VSETMEEYKRVLSFAREIEEVIDYIRVMPFMPLDRVNALAQSIRAGAFNHCLARLPELGAEAVADLIVLSAEQNRGAIK